MTKPFGYEFVIFKIIKLPIKIVYIIVNILICFTFAILMMASDTQFFQTFGLLHQSLDLTSSYFGGINPYYIQTVPH